MSSSNSGSGASISRRRKSSEKQNLETILYREMYTNKASTLEELWQYTNSDESFYMPSIHFVIVNYARSQYLFRENEDKSEIFGCKLIKLNKKNLQLE